MISRKRHHDRDLGEPIQGPDEPAYFAAPDRPHAEIEQVGRWRYRIYITDGLMCYGPDGYGWYKWGLRRAKAKADRELARYLVKESRRTHRWTVQP